MKRSCFIAATAAVVAAAAIPVPAPALPDPSVEMIDVVEYWWRDHDLVFNGGPIFADDQPWVWKHVKGTIDLATGAFTPDGDA